MPKLQNRLMVVMTVLTTGTVILVGSAVYIVGEAKLRNSLDEALVGLARTELASATDTGFVHVHEPEAQMLTLKGIPSYEKYVWVVNAKDKIVAKTMNVGDELTFTQAEPFANHAREGHTIFGDINYRGLPIRAVFYKFSDVDGSPLVGVVGVPNSVVTSSITSVGQVVVIVGVACIAIALVAIVILAKSLSRPLRALARAAAEVDLVHPDDAEPLKAPYQEINGVATAINRLVERVGKMLGERNRIIAGQRQFIADASHELRTPVSNTHGTIEVALRRERTPDEYRATLQTSLQEVDRMGRLINDLLALSKTDVGEFTIVPTCTDLVAIAKRAVNMLESGSRLLPRIEVSAPNEIIVNADPDRIRQALDNLLSNAVAHATTTIKVEGRVEQDRAIIDVINDGPGLAPGDEVKVFDRFYRSDQSRSRDTGGSGLGLAIVKSIAEGHGGTVSCRSANGWTTFTISLPLAPK